MSQFTHGHALIIGMGADLPNTVQDAAGLAQILQDAERCAYPPEQVTLLAGEQATRLAILSALDALSHLSDPQATVVVYFSGHGYRVSASLGEFYYLMPFGYDTERLFDTAIRGDEFTSRLRLIPAQKLLVLLDCCHAGGLAKPEPAGMKLAKSPLPPEAASLLAEGRGRVLIASSQQDEVSFAGRPYSAFTLALIEALCGVGAAVQDGFVRVTDLAMHAREVVPGRTGSRQHPILNFEQADNFPLAYYAAGGVQAKGLPFTEPPAIEPEPGVWGGTTVSQTAIGQGNVQVSMDNVSGSTVHIDLGGRGAEPKRSSG
jgi:Caspase domain